MAFSAAMSCFSWIGRRSHFAHLLRASDVQALPPNHAAQVPMRNRATLAQMGFAQLRELHAGLRSMQ